MEAGETGGCTRGEEEEVEEEALAAQLQGSQKWVILPSRWMDVVNVSTSPAKQAGQVLPFVSVPTVP